MSVIQHTAWCQFLAALEDRPLDEALARRRDHLPEELATIVGTTATYWEHMERLDEAITEAWKNVEESPNCLYGCGQ